LGYRDPVARVVLYYISGHCPLCDQARDVLQRAAPGFEAVDIRSDRELLRAYRDEVPVVTVDGRKEFIGRVEPARLRALLGHPADTPETG